MRIWHRSGVHSPCARGGACRWRARGLTNSAGGDVSDVDPLLCNQPWPTTPDDAFRQRMRYRRRLQQRTALKKVAVHLARRDLVRWKVPASTTAGPSRSIGDGDLALRHVICPTSGAYINSTDLEAITNLQVQTHLFASCGL